MSIKVKLEKDGRVVNGFTGFSWTLVFFGFWVPAFRERGNVFYLFYYESYSYCYVSFTN